MKVHAVIGLRVRYFPPPISSGYSFRGTADNEPKVSTPEGIVSLLFGAQMLLSHPRKYYPYLRVKIVKLYMYVCVYTKIIFMIHDLCTYKTNLIIVGKE